MAGILFSCHVEGRLTLRYGPWSSGCRMEDWREADALKIGECTRVADAMRLAAPVSHQNGDH